MACAALLSACANTALVKDVLASPDAYLAQFASAPLPADAAKRFGAAAGPSAFQRIEMDVQIEEERTGQPARSVSTRMVLTDAGNGLIRSYEEVRNNGVAFRTNYKLGYRGLLPVRWQTVFHNRSNADVPFEVKSFSQFSTLDASTQPGTTLRYAMADGSQVQIANFMNAEAVCTVGAQQPASTLHPAIEGNAIEISCDHYGSNGQVVGKSTSSYLVRYGVAVRRNYVNSDTRNTHQIQSVKIS